MRQRSPITRRDVKQLFPALLPMAMLPLVRKRLITEEHLVDRPTLVRQFRRHVGKHVNAIEISVALDEDFLQEALRLWKRSDRHIAVVLYATAIEQLVNSMYQHILPAQGWRRAHVTLLLREASLGSKIGWMFEAFTQRRFPTVLAKRLHTIIQIRNAIVHFKAEIGTPLCDDDSYSKVGAQIKAIRRFQLSRDYYLVHNAFLKALLSSDPDRSVTLRACALILGN